MINTGKADILIMPGIETEIEIEIETGIGPGETAEMIETEIGGTTIMEGK